MGCSVAWKCFVAWRLGLWSQQPTADGCTSFIWLVWLHRCRWNICINLLIDALLRPAPFRPQVGRSERRALGLQEFGLLGRGLPAQDPIPVREPPEPLDYVP